MKKFFNEFKTFISRGNVLDLAVAVIIGAAFGKITTSLVNDILMPIIGLAIGGLSVSDWKIVLYSQFDADGNLLVENALYYGNFIQAVIDFLLIALVIFLILKAFNAANKGLSEMATLENILTKEELAELVKQGKTRKQIRKIKVERLNEQRRVEAEKASVVVPTNTEVLLAEIRDLLKKEDTNK